MQRDRARERMERARRQWELENAEMEAHDAATAAASAGGTTTEAATTSSAAGVATSTTSTTTAAATTAVSTSSTVTGSTPVAISTKANGNPRAVSANHIAADGPSAFILVSLGGVILLLESLKKFSENPGIPVSFVPFFQVPLDY